MKKLVLISTLVTTLAGLSAFGQGYFLFGGSKSSVWDGTGATDVRNSAIDVAFLWAPAATTSKVGTDTALTGAAALAGVPNTMNSANATYQASAAWADIFTDPNFQFGLDSNTGDSLAVQLCLTSGSWTFVGQPAVPANTFGVTGTSSSTTYSIFAIGWSSAYATPTAAELAGGKVGWSTVLQYTFGSPISTLSQPVWTQFAVTGAGPVPEPTTLALAGLGGLSLLLFRRRK